MNKFLLFCAALFCASFAKAQTTYYWVGNPGDSINITSNWNTSLNGGGTARPSNNSTSDVLIFDGSNLGGSTPFFPVVSTAGISCGQLKLVNNAIIQMVRTVSGTTTIALSGDATAGTEDFLIESGCSLTLANGPGSQVITISGSNSTGRVSGNFAMITGLQAGIRNGTTAGPILVFTSGSTFTTNITATSAAYAFGNSSQSTEKWVTFQAGSTLYYDGGFSPMASSSTFQPVNFLPGSNFVMRASNPVSGSGTFFNRKAYANVVVQNGATATADGPIYRIDNLTIASGSAFVLPASGQTAILGNVIADGNIATPTGSTNSVVLGGNTTQTISGSGQVTLPTLLVGNNAKVVLNKNATVNDAVQVYGQINFNTYQLTGSSNAFVNAGGSGGGTAQTVSGSSIVYGPSGTVNALIGSTITGSGIPANTTILATFTSASLIDSVYLSQPATATASNVSLIYKIDTGTLVTANPFGFDPVLGSIANTGSKFFAPGINYEINAATVTPFGKTTNNTPSPIAIGKALFNAPVTTNASVKILTSLQATNGKVTIRPGDSMWLAPRANLNGTYNGSTYFVTDTNATGSIGVFRRDSLTGSSLFPVGTSVHYLPATVSPVSASDFAVNVFQGITANATPTGTPLTSLQKQTVVDAVWNVNRIAGSGDAALKLQWTPALEGTTLATFANSEIGIIKNNGTSWSLPFGTGDNTANTADTLFNNFGSFSVGARPPSNPFVFNALPPKTYGDADFSAGVISSNTTSPTNYTSSNTAVATIINGKIHISGTGTTIITATQASDGFYPAANVAQTLTVNKASLTIKADRKIKPEGDPNPPLTATYTGFVLAETPAVLLTPAVLTTTATQSSPPGNYLIAVSGATAANYNINFINDSLIIKPRSVQTITFPALPAKSYGAADFAVGASSSNNTIPVTYTSSNTSVATIVGNNVHIVGAGTTIITASQAGSDLFFAATPVSQTLTVAKASLTVRVADTTKSYGEANPAFRLVYAGFVLGQSSTVLTTQPTVNTTAMTLSAPGYYSLDPSGAVAANYNISYVSGRLTIYPSTGTSQPNLQAFMSNSSTLTVRIYSALPDIGDVLIYDMNGKALRRKNVFMPQGFISTTFAINGIPSGIYAVQVIAKNTTLKLTISIIH